MESAASKSRPLPVAAEPAWRRAWQSLWPAPMAIGWRERLRVAFGVGVGLLVTTLACLAMQAVLGLDQPWLAAPIGASAVIVFGLPSSPLAQPWAVVAGNTVSALVGVAAAQLLHGGPWATAAPGLAGACAVALMFALRCLHPPGGAVAVLVSLAGVRSWGFALYPIAANAVLLVLAAAAYNRASGKAYPHPQREVPARSAEGRFIDADIDRVLARYDEVLDIPRDELHALLEAAESEAYRRRLGELSCAEVMSQPVLSVAFGTPLQEAWALLRERHVKAIPVVDRGRRVVGVLTLADFLRGADLALHEDFAGRLRRFLAPTRRDTSDKPEVVGQIMTRRVQVVSADCSLAALVPVFAATGHHHIPVVDAELRLVGILTQTDLIRALMHRG